MHRIRPRRSPADWPAAPWESCAFPVLYTGLVVPGLLTLERLIVLMADNPRRIFGLEGGLHVGDAADFTVLDLDDEYLIDPSAFRSKGRATPFAGWRVRGRAVRTVVGGRTVYEAAAPSGQVRTGR